MSQRRARTTRDGYDRVGPFHPYVAWTAVALFDLSLIAFVVLTLLVGVDWTEDLIFPGGPEMLPF
jgi:hypothetical protein